MTVLPRDYIFVSYSHNDDEWLARLRVFLKPFPWAHSYRDGGHLWADRYIQTGERWRREIGDGLARTRIAVLLISPDFLASDFIASHELPVLLQAAHAGDVAVVCIPVRTNLVDLVHPELLEFQWPRPYDQPLDILGSAEREAALAQILRQLVEIATTTGITELPAAPRIPAAPPVLQTRPIETQPAASSRGRLFGVPEQRPHHIPRLDVRDRIRTVLLAGSCGVVGLTGTGVDARTTRIGVYGQGGLGKTVSAIDVVHDEEVRRAFPDGIYWLTLGQHPDVLAAQAVLIQQITAAPAVVKSVPAGSERLRELLADRASLIVLDDVWRYEHASAFNVVGERSRLLTTTRDATILTALGAADIELDVLSEGQALALLSTWTNQPIAALPPQAAAVAKRCGYLPLALAVAGALVRDGLPWNHIIAALEAGNVRFLEHPYASVFASLRLSLDALSEHVRARYIELGVAPEDVPLPVGVVTRFWAHTGGMAEYECRHLLADLERKGLLYVEGEGADASVHLHDLQRDFLELAADRIRSLHLQLLEALARDLPSPAAPSHRAWWSLPETEAYAWQHLAYHLIKAGLRSELRALLLDYDWIAAKLRVTDVNALLADYDPLNGDTCADSVHAALRLSAHVLATDDTQLVSQLSGRLLSIPQQEIQTLLATARARSSRMTWLRPVTSSLTAAGGPLIRTLQGHTDEVTAAAVTADGRRAVSGCKDGTLRVWDLASGSVLHTLKGHTDAVAAVAVTPDCRAAVSASEDRAVKVWDLATGDEIYTLTDRRDRVVAVAITPDSRCAIAAISEYLQVWDLASATIVRTLDDSLPKPGPIHVVTAVAVTPDGRRAVSASQDDKIKVWDLATGEKLNEFGGHRRYVYGLAITQDSRYFIPASDDATLEVWDIDTGTLVRTLEGHKYRVTSVAVLPDNRRAISGGADDTLKLWALDTGELLYTFHGHTDDVTAVAATPDGRRVVSASKDQTLKVWDLTNAVARDPSDDHTAAVTDIAITSDDRRAISASRDGTVKIWDVATGRVLQTLRGHDGWVRSVAVTPDHRRIVSASDDTTVKIWDLETGALLQTLEGHHCRVTLVVAAPDGRRLLSADWEGLINVWDIETGEVIRALRQGGDGYTKIAVTPDGLRVVSGSDYLVKVWDLETGALLHTHQSGDVTSVALTPDGHRAVSSGGRGIIVYDLDSGRVLHHARDHTAWVSGVAVTPDGGHAVSGSYDLTVKVLDLTRGAVLHSLEGHTHDITGIAVTPNGRHAISRCKAGTLKVWDLVRGELVTTFTADGLIWSCAMTSDSLTFIAADGIGRVHFLRLEERQARPSATAAAC